MASTTIGGLPPTVQGVVRDGCPRYRGDFGNFRGNLVAYRFSPVAVIARIWRYKREAMAEITAASSLIIAHIVLRKRRRRQACIDQIGF